MQYSTKQKEQKTSFKARHSPFVKSVYKISFYIGSIYALFSWITALFTAAKHGNVVGFILTLVLQSVYTIITSFLFAAILGTVATIVLFVPYVVYRELKINEP